MVRQSGDILPEGCRSLDTQCKLMNMQTSNSELVGRRQGIVSLSINRDGTLNHNPSTIRTVARRISTVQPPGCPSSTYSNPERSLLV